MDMYAHKAVDGNYNTSDNACTLTEAEDAPWWLVELEDVYLVENVVIQTGGKFIISTYTSDYFGFDWAHRGSICADPEGASMGPDPACNSHKYRVSWQSYSGSLEKSCHRAQKNPNRPRWQSNLGRRI